MILHLIRVKAIALTVDSFGFVSNIAIVINQARLTTHEEKRLMILDESRFGICALRRNSLNGEQNVKENRRRQRAGANASSRTETARTKSCRGGSRILAIRLSAGLQLSFDVRDPSTACVTFLSSRTVKEAECIAKSRYHWSLSPLLWRFNQVMFILIIYSNMWRKIKTRSRIIACFFHFAWCSL